MEGLIVLIVLVLVGGVVILPIASFIRAGRAVRDTENLRRKVAALEFELRHLTRERHPPTPSPEATTHEPSVPAETTDEARTDLPEFLTPVPPQYATWSEPSAAFTAQPEDVPGPTTHAPPPLPPVVTPRPVAPSGPQLPKIDWEQFMGVKLFAWLGGSRSSSPSVIS